MKKRVLWRCSNADHPGVLGPSRPRKDHLCRYCFKCSEAVGRLTERVAPSLETRRAEKRAVRRAHTNAVARNERAKLRAMTKDMADEFRCGLRAANFIAVGDCPPSLRRINVKLGAENKPATFGKTGMTIVDHNRDRYEAQAAVIVAVARWRVERVQNIPPRTPVYTQQLRAMIEWLTSGRGGIRPLLNNLSPSRIEAEVADLLRRREAVAELASNG